MYCSKYIVNIVFYHIDFKTHANTSEISGKQNGFFVSLANSEIKLSRVWVIGRYLSFVKTGYREWYIFIANKVT